MALLQSHSRLKGLVAPAKVSGLPAGVRPFHPAAAPAKRPRCVVKAADDDAELEQRLAALRKVKGATPDGEGAKAKKRGATATAAAPKPAAEKKLYDYTNEQTHWEGGPAAGDLAFNIGLGATLVALPLTIGAIARSAFVRYKFTDKRVSVCTTAPWENKQTDCAYQEVKDVRVVSRGLGLWGDMVIELRNGDKLELRSLEKFKELRDYVLARRDALGGGSRGDKTPSIMNLDIDDDEAMKKKGFA